MPETERLFEPGRCICCPSGHHVPGGLTQLLQYLGRLETRRRDVEATISERVGRARLAGATWSDIGAALGMTRQGAQQKYGKDR